MNEEIQRLEEDQARIKNWKRWGPYLSERQWATVREDYSQEENPWEYFPHEHARSRAYRWGEDGYSGLRTANADSVSRSRFGTVRDHILKERLFGLTGPEGNHGEDVKECYFYLDSSPTHAYLKALYKYPQDAFPYDELVRENRWRSLNLPEYELIDTGIFEESRYFDVFAEYAKQSPQRYSHPDYRRQSRRGSSRGRVSSDSLVPKYLGLGLFTRGLFAETTDLAQQGWMDRDGARNP